MWLVRQIFNFRSHHRLRNMFTMKISTFTVLSCTVATTLTLGNVVNGTGQILLDDLQCTGSESRLVNCPHNGLGNHNCDHTDDAGVRCAPGMYKTK